MSRNKISFITKYFVIFLISLLIMMPLWDMVINSFKSAKESEIPNINLPKKWEVVENYKTVIQKGKLVRSFFNSLLITGSSTFLILAISTMAAFVFGRRKERSFKAIFFIFLMGIITPPSYVIMTILLKNLNLLGTYIGMILVFTAVFCPLPIFILTSFMTTVPKEVEEAAIIDGASPAGLFLRINLPLLKPAMATCFIWVVMRIWNDLLFPIYILAGNTKKYTMILSLYFFKVSFYTSWSLVFADLVLVSLPVIIAFIFAQKYMVEGMTAGAVKG